MIRKTILLAATALGVIAAGTAQGANVVTLAQTSNSNTLSATVNGADTVTTLSIDSAAVGISQLISGAPPATAFFSLNATSIDPVTTIGTAVLQHYSGTFCLTSAIGCGGINVLSGTFTDAAFGAAGGPGLVINVNSPPDSLVLSSSLIPASELVSPNAMSLGFTNVSPLLGIVGSTIAPMTASFAGTVSSSAAVVPEPASLALFGVGLLGLAAARRRTHG